MPIRQRRCFGNASAANDDHQRPSQRSPPSAPAETTTQPSHDRARKHTMNTSGTRCSVSAMPMPLAEPEPARDAEQPCRAPAAAALAAGIPKTSPAMPPARWNTAKLPPDKTSPPVRARPPRSPPAPAQRENPPRGRQQTPSGRRAQPQAGQPAPPPDAPPHSAKASPSPHVPSLQLAARAG